MLPFLLATPTVFQLDPQAGQLSGTSSIEYGKEASQIVWHRSKPGLWERVNLQVTIAEIDPALTHGYFNSLELKPGDMYQAAIWDDGVDPNRLGEVNRKPVRARASTMVLCLRKQPGPVELLRDKNGHTGGTFRSQHVSTSKPAFARFSVGRGAPDDDGLGMLRVNSPVTEVWAGQGQSFTLDALDLLPGTHYWGLVLMVDESGGWQQLKLEFTTLKRRVRVVFNRIFIRDDGDTFSNGEALFTFLLETGSVSTGGWIERDAGQNYNDNLDDGNYITPGPNVVLVIGPEAVGPQSTACRIRVQGSQNDKGTILGASRRFGESLKDLFVPVHTVDEVVLGRADQVRVKAFHSDFSFDAHFIYSIDYS